MASKKLMKAIMEILEPEGWDDLSPEELEDFEDDVIDIIEAVEAHQAETLRLLVVGQIQHDGSDKVHTVALGPYGARGKLDTMEKFNKAAQGSTAAHDQGGKLAWDARTGKGKGRYMVVPLLRTPRDAWDLYRTDSSINPDAVAENIVQSFGIANPDVVPSCTCGVRPESGHQNVMGIPVTRKCFRHMEK